jgi:hypothetical protein
LRYKTEFNSRSIHNQEYKLQKIPDITLETPVWGKPAKRGFYWASKRNNYSSKVTENFLQIFSAKSQFLSANNQSY